MGKFAYEAKCKNYMLFNGRKKKDYHKIDKIYQVYLLTCKVDMWIFQLVLFTFKLCVT